MTNFIQTMLAAWFLPGHVVSFHVLEIHLQIYPSKINLVGGWTNPFEKYAIVKLDHFPRGSGVKMKKMKPPPSVNHPWIGDLRFHTTRGVPHGIPRVFNPLISPGAKPSSVIVLLPVMPASLIRKFNGRSLERREMAFPLAQKYF